MEDSAGTSASSAADAVPSGQPSGAARTRGRLSTFLDTYARTAGAPSLGRIRADLWVGDADEAWRSRGPAYETAVLEQYKIYVEMADRISGRRSTANAFFLTL